jgi:hypothetical protein
MKENEALRRPTQTSRPISSFDVSREQASTHSQRLRFHHALGVTGLAA